MLPDKVEVVLSLDKLAKRERDARRPGGQTRAERLRPGKVTGMARPDDDRCSGAPRGWPRGRRQRARDADQARVARRGVDRSGSAVRAQNATQRSSPWPGQRPKPSTAVTAWTGKRSCGASPGRPTWPARCAISTAPPSLRRSIKRDSSSPSTGAPSRLWRTALLERGELTGDDIRALIGSNQDKG